MTNLVCLFLDVPTCYDREISIPLEVCTNVKMTLGSRSYFGLPQSESERVEYWLIRVLDVVTIILKFIDFDVNCKMGK